MLILKKLHEHAGHVVLCVIPTLLHSNAKKHLVYGTYVDTYCLFWVLCHFKYKVTYELTKIYKRTIVLEMQSNAVLMYSMYLC